MVQFGVVLQNHILHMILILIQSPHFACLPFEIETEFEGVVLSKVVHHVVVLDEVQRVGVVWFRKLLIQGLKVGVMVKMAEVTIISCELQIHSNWI